MKVAFIVPCRNKDEYVGPCVRTVLAQTYSPMSIFISDQGSEDGTLAVIEDIVAGYNGPNKIRILRCPEVEHRKMPGLNAHFNWLHEQIDGDIVISCSADDLNHPDRAKYVVRAFEEHNPSYVCTGVQYLESDQQDGGQVWFPDKRTRMLGIEETIKYNLGSSGSSAWARDLYEKCKPLIGYEQQDLILPSMALLDRGVYWVDLPLHTYIRHASLENTGFGGQMMAATSDLHKAQLLEHNNFAHVRNWTSVLRRWQNLGRPVPQEAVDIMVQRIVETSNAWAGVREGLMMSGVSPL